MFLLCTIFLIHKWRTITINTVLIASPIKKKCTSESAYCSCKCLHFTVLIYSTTSLFLSCTWLVVAVLGYVGTDHWGQGLNAKVLWSKLWRSSKNSKVATFIRLNGNCHFHCLWYGMLCVWKSTVWVRLFILAFAGSCQIWCELILLESCKTVIISYFLIIVWWQTLDEGRRRTSLGDKTLRGFCLSAAVHEPLAAVHTLFTVLEKNPTENYHSRWRRFVCVSLQPITPRAYSFLCWSLPSLQQSILVHLHLPSSSTLAWC